MNCPACQRPLRRFKAKTVTLDGCDGGCGGIWFDYGELNKVNRLHPHPDDQVASLSQDPTVKVDDDAVRSCPRCSGITLDKKLYSLGSGVILDRCPKCKGIWLDGGELEKIREALHPRPHRPQIIPRSAPPLRIAVNFEIMQQVDVLLQNSQAQA